MSDECCNDSVVVLVFLRYSCLDFIFLYIKDKDQLNQTTCASLNYISLVNLSGEGKAIRNYN